MDFPAVTVHKSMGHVLESHGVTLKKAETDGYNNDGYNDEGWKIFA